MKRRPRNKYTAEQVSTMWDCYSKGESLHTIARMFDRFHGFVAGIFGRSGGIRPPDRKRRDTYLSIEEREDISRGIIAGLSIRAIAQSLNRAPSTISREISRNGGRIKYRASKADTNAWRLAKRPKTCKLLQNKSLALTVASKLKQDWSPQQIAGWLKYNYSDDLERCVSHETI